MRSYRTEPLWVIFIYPFYGMFGLFTRACAFVVFLYRRFAAKLSRAAYYDDYRQATQNVKLASTVLAVAVLTIGLVLNLVLNYSALFTGFGIHT